MQEEQGAGSQVSQQIQTHSMAWLCGSRDRPWERGGKDAIPSQLPLNSDLVWVALGHWAKGASPF